MGTQPEVLRMMAFSVEMPEKIVQVMLNFCISSSSSSIFLSLIFDYIVIIKLGSFVFWFLAHTNTPGTVLSALHEVIYLLLSQALGAG